MDATERQLRERAKAMMRRRARGVRASVPEAALAQRSARIAERLVRHPAIHRADRIALFWPILRHKEVDLRALHAGLREEGKRVAYPRLEGAGEAMSFVWVDDPRELDERGHGFAEPAPDRPTVDALEVIVVPALVVDARGHRIGYGAGYYDRTLPLFRPPAVAIAVAYDFQLAPEVPTLEQDVPVDAIVTDLREWLVPGARSG